VRFTVPVTLIVAAVNELPATLTVALPLVVDPTVSVPPVALKVPLTPNVVATVSVPAEIANVPVASVSERLWTESLAVEEWVIVTPEL
jgi:hypothetical protein